MKRVVLISYHYYGSRRRAGFHWLADAFHQLGWEVVFVTAPISWLHRLSRNFRFQYPVRAEANRLIPVRKRFYSYVLFTPIHPANFRSKLLNNMFRNILSRYEQTPLGELSPKIAEADLVIFESTPALLLFRQIKALNPHARLIYRVSDDIHLLDVHPLVIEAEAELAPQFDLVSVPSEYLYEKFSHLPNTRLQYHGVQKALFDQPLPSPYRGAINAVFVGNHPHLDWECLETAAALFPHLKFHIIGDVKGDSPHENIKLYGVMPFRETIPYIQHADIGLHPVAYVRGAESATDSLKVLQYSFCRLPVVMPEFIRSRRENVFHYQPHNRQSIQHCFEAALSFNQNNSFIPAEILTWEELVEEMVCSNEKIQNFILAMFLQQS